MSEWVLAAKITSLGDDSATGATDRRYRWSTGTPTGGDSDWRSLFQPYLSDKLPQEIAVQIDFSAATTSTGALSIGLQYVDTTGQSLYRHNVDRIGRLETTVAAGAGTIQINDDAGSGVAGLAVGAQLAIEQEVMTITADNTGGSYDVDRGRLGTVDAKHIGRASDETADTEVFYSSHGHLLTDRELVLIRVPTTGSETDEEVLYRGVVSGIGRNGNTIKISTRTITEMLNKRKLCAALARGEMRPDGPEWAHVLLDAFPTHKGVNADADNVFPLSLGGKTAVIQVFRASMTFTPQQYNRVDTFAFGESPPPMAEDIDTADIWEFFSLSPSAPSLDAAGDVRLGREGNAASGDPVANPFTLLLQLLLTTPTGDNHATYDLGDTDNPGIFNNLGLGIPAALVDVDAIETVRASTPALMTSLHMGFDGQAIDDALAWIQQKLLKPYACVLTVGEDFKLTVVKLESQVTSLTPTIVEADFIGIGDGDRKMDTVFDRIAAKYNDRPGIGPKEELVTDAINRQRLVSGRHSDVDLDASGVTEREKMIGLCQKLVQRFHHPLPLERFVLLNTKSYWPGQVLSVTHSKIPGTDGTLGVTTAAFQIIGRRNSIGEARISYDCVYVGAIFARTGLIAGALVTDGVPVARVYPIVRNTVTGTVGPDDAIQDDYQAFAVGDWVQATTRKHAVAGGGVIKQIEAITATSVTIADSDWVPSLTTGSVIKPASWASSSSGPTAAQRALWTWIADRNYTLGSDSEAAFEYT